MMRIQDDGKMYYIEVLHDETAAQKDRIQQLMQQLRDRK